MPPFKQIATLSTFIILHIADNEVIKDRTEYSFFDTNVSTFFNILLNPVNPNITFPSKLKLLPIGRL